VYSHESDLCIQRACTYHVVDGALTPVEAVVGGQVGEVRDCVHGRWIIVLAVKCIGVEGRLQQTHFPLSAATQAAHHSSFDIPKAAKKSKGFVTLCYLRSILSVVSFDAVDVPGGRRSGPCHFQNLASTLPQGMHLPALTSNLTGRHLLKGNIML
jgi:hypothetical protein